MEFRASPVGGTDCPKSAQVENQKGLYYNLGDLKGVRCNFLPVVRLP
jgi:hypothetical protein